MLQITFNFLDIYTTGDVLVRAESLLCYATSPLCNRLTLHLSV